jgi:hypothetical protein
MRPKQAINAHFGTLLLSRFNKRCSRAFVKHPEADGRA